eukprot:3996865-Prymnesium_polylepis.1
MTGGRPPVDAPSHWLRSGMDLHTLREGCTSCTSCSRESASQERSATMTKVTVLSIKKYAGELEQL